MQQHQSILGYKGGRYLKLALLACAAAIGAYAWHEPPMIQLATVDPKRRPPSLLAWLMTGLTDEPGREQHEERKDRAKKAVKCDMCKDLSGGPACVRACPTGAAIRVSPESFLEYAGG